MALHVPGNMWKIIRSRKYTPAQLHERQLTLLNELIAASQNIPLYRVKYKSLGAAALQLSALEEFLKFPPCTKDDIKRNFPDRIVADGKDWRSIYQVATSGTSDRVMIFQDEYRRDWDRAADYNHLFFSHPFIGNKRRVTIPADACYERCGIDSHGREDKLSDKLKGWRQADLKERKKALMAVVAFLIRKYIRQDKFMKSLGVDGTATKDDILAGYRQDILAWQPTVISALPMNVFIIAKSVPEDSTQHYAQFVRPSGGLITPFMAQTIERAFKAKVRQNYGTAELGTIAYDCLNNTNQHLLTQIQYVEFLRYGKPVVPGELGEIYVTDLRNRVSPLIRYRVGDVGRVVGNRCSCGYYGLLFQVEGRLDEVIVTPEGKVFTPSESIDFFLARPEFSFVKLVQRSDGQFTLEYVPSVAAEALDAQRLAKRLSQEFSDFLGTSVQVSLRKVRRIPPEGSGKYKLVISKSYDRFHQEYSNDKNGGKSNSYCKAQTLQHQLTI